METIKETNRSLERFQVLINNGWANSYLESFNKIYQELIRGVYERKSKVTIHNVHEPEIIGKFIEQLFDDIFKMTSSGITCFTYVTFDINIDYDSLSVADFQELKTNIKIYFKYEEQRTN